jgi:hypothetical protein
MLDIAVELLKLLSMAIETNLESNPLRTAPDRHSIAIVATGAARGAEVRTMATKHWIDGKLVEVQHPDRKCQDCVHYVSRGYCDRGSNPDVTGPEAQSCYSYVTEATLIRRE